IPSAVEELLRFASPVWFFRRTATTAISLRGAEIGAGDKVVVWFAAANRDADHYAEPHRLDIARNPTDHLTFGRGGPHFCLVAAPLRSASPPRRTTRTAPGPHPPRDARERRPRNAGRAPRLPRPRRRRRRRPRRDLRRAAAAPGDGGTSHVLAFRAYARDVFR